MTAQIVFEKLKKAASDQKLVVVVGTGLSRALASDHSDVFSWGGLIENGFQFALNRGAITPSQSSAWQVHLRSSDIDDLLGAAEFVGRKLSAPSGPLYARWLESCFGSVSVVENGLAAAIQALANADVPIATLNYDTILEEITGLPSIVFSDTGGVSSWMRRENKGILHLHGIWHKPSSCVLGIRDYKDTLEDDVRDLVQRALGSFGQLLFIGCGDTFADPNFSNLLQWLRENMASATPVHHALVRESEVAARHADRAWQGFVEPLSYGPEYSDLEAGIRAILPSKIKPSRRGESRARSAEKASLALDRYRAFLLRDCGTMTIEGVRADMDTAQRRFDLERLFVPLRTQAAPPDYPMTDPLRDQKIQRWLAENNEPIAFGEALQKSKKIALLALPGGGKTILLKRLAIAYCDPARRNKSDDNLPDLDVFPILIRCREWRDQISKPIATLLQNIASVTGQSDLSGFFDAVEPLLKKGKVLLLVDGLDEIHNDADRSVFVENLEKFLEDYSKIRLIVTSREAGFALVAPTLARFCKRWRVAPLEEDAITTLCRHWHRLMTGDTPEALREADDVAERLLATPAIRRLAENPLLLTMLLVVKHGAGRLPPDRVSLYGRAVDVLLDTWNIKGHDALNVKEAVPQLAYVAFELMRRGRQTATEKELAQLIEEARDNVPQIRRYAKDSPHEFLKRVELRSSLLVEAGYQKEGVETVPFYQFRHLTFQEYLAAVAAVEGHYDGYVSNNTIMVPLQNYVEAEEWKEVIPMASVLARKQAEPILSYLSDRAGKVAELAMAGSEFEGKEKWIGQEQLTGAPALLLQCLTEEAEGSSATLEVALRHLAVMARGCRNSTNWPVLIAGPYGEEFLHQAWKLYSAESHRDLWLRNTVAVALAMRTPSESWPLPETIEALTSDIRSGTKEEIRRALLSIAGCMWSGHAAFKVVPEFPAHLLEKHATSEDPDIWEPATWVIGLVNRAKMAFVPSNELLDGLVSRYLEAKDERFSVANFTLGRFLGLSRDRWVPKLSAKQRKAIKNRLLSARNENSPAREGLGDTVVAFHARDILPDEALAPLIRRERSLDSGATAALQQMGTSGEAILAKARSAR